MAEIYDREGLTQLFNHLWAPEAPPTHVFIKVHGYAPGTYTDPVALDALLSALPGQAILIEGHTSSRNLSGAPFLSFARFKGPTRLSVANMFGLIPTVLRTAWPGPDIMHFARACCDMAKLYGCLFRVYGMVEGLNVAVRWHRQGLYRSRWGHYDLIPHPGIVTLSRGLPIADVLASRLQGRQIQSIAFFQVMRRELGFSDEIAHLPIPEDLVLRVV